MEALFLVAAAFAPFQAVPSDPAVRALEAARERLPARLRARVAGVELERARDLGVPESAPLAQRLFGRGALAYFDAARGVVVLTDAGARGRATWIDAPPTIDAVETFLATLAPPLDGEDAESRWRSFRTAIEGWRGRAIGGGLGETVVLQAFLDEAPWRALGGNVALEPLLLHELAHAVQLGPDDFVRRVQAWSAVTGWRERHDDSLADGMRAAWLNERPEALIRELLGGERGASNFAPGAGPSPNLYARFDPREDFAEALRLMAYDPERLADEFPARFLAANATGWVADLDARQPGPLWRGPDDVDRDRFEGAVARGTRELWARWCRTPDAEPHAFAAVLRAHGDWIPPDIVPDEDPRPLPKDLPPGLAERIADATFTVADGTERALPAGARDAFLAHALARHADLARAEAELLQILRSLESDEPERIEAEAARKRAARPVGRARALEIEALCAPGGDARADAVRRRIALEEAARLDAADLPSVAARLRLRFATRSLDDRVATARKRLALGSAYDDVELAAAVVDELVRADRTVEAAAAIRAIPGGTWGARRRVEAWLLVGDPGAATEAAATSRLPGERIALQSLVTEARRASRDR